MARKRRLPTVVPSFESCLLWLPEEEHPFRIRVTTYRFRSQHMEIMIAAELWLLWPDLVTSHCYYRAGEELRNTNTDRALAALMRACIALNEYWESKSLEEHVEQARRSWEGWGHLSARMTEGRLPE